MATSVSEAQQPSRITVAQLSHLLESSHGKKDSWLTRQLSTLVLTERPPSAAVARWQAELPGGKTRLALTRLVDASDFFDPPSSEMPGLPQPDPQKLKQIVLQSNEYVKDTVPRLPDFYALRTTTYFLETPAGAPDWPNFCKSPKMPALGSGCVTMGASRLNSRPTESGTQRVTGESTETVTYHNGYETLSDQVSNPLSPLEFLGLVTNGEFGPILSVVIEDALHGKILWGYWEQGAKGPLAVIRYSVPKASSHYEVDFPFPLSQEKLHPAYHGEIAIDPATGSISRISVIDDLQPDYHGLATAVMLEYGPVTIGGKSCNCPIRGVAYSKVPLFARRGGTNVKLPFTRTRLNDIRFSGYHLFRGDVRVLTHAASNPQPDEASSTPSTH